MKCEIKRLFDLIKLNRGIKVIRSDANGPEALRVEPDELVSV